MRLWDVDSGRELRRFQGHDAGSPRVAFSPDGRRALSGSWDQTVRVWDVETGQAIARFGGHDGCDLLRGDLPRRPPRPLRRRGPDPAAVGPGPRPGASSEGSTKAVAGAAFSPDGRRALSGDYGGTVRLWDVETGRELHRFTASRFGGHERGVLPDGRRALSGGWDNTLRLWRLPESLAAEAAGAPGPGVEVLRLDGKDGEILRLDAKGGEVGAVAFSHDGRLILSGSHDRLLHLWEAETGRESLRIAGHTDRLTGVAFTPDDRMAVSSGADRTVRLWDLEDGREIRKFEGHTDVAQSVAVSPDGRRIVSGGLNELFLWDLASGKLLGKFPGVADWVRNVAIAADGRYLPLGQRRPHRPPLGHGDRSRAPQIRRARGYRRGRGPLARRPHRRDRQPRHDARGLGRPDRPRAPAIPRPYRSGGVRGHLPRRPLRALLQRRRGRYDPPLGAEETGRELLKLAGHTDGVTSVCFSPDGRRALSGGVDGTVRIWDLKSPVPDGAAPRAIGVPR